MNTRNAKILKACLSRSKERETLERFLPENERIFLSELPPFGEPPSRIDSTIHYSWFIPLIKNDPIYLGALDPDSAKEVEEILSIKKPELPESARNFLCTELMKKLTPESVLPPQFLPESPLNALLSIHKKDLIRLIDFLCLYDVSFEFRQILETKNLKRIYSLLSEEQRGMLAKISAPQEIKPLALLGLERWEGSAQELKTALHRRGLTRMGLALKNEDPDLIWWVAHKLDSGRGSALLKVEESSITAKAQVEEILRNL